MVSKKRKTEIVEELRSTLQGATSIYLVDFVKLTVAESHKLRRLLKEKDVVFKVAKNTLIQRAIDGMDGFQFPEDKFTGQTALFIGYDDPIAAAKVLKEFSEKTEIPKLKAAIIEGQLFDGSQLKTLATMPTRADMIASIIGSINAPISGIVGSINAVMRELASVIEEVAKTKAA